MASCNNCRYTMYDDGLFGGQDSDEEAEEKRCNANKVSIGMKAPLLRSTSLGFVR